MHPTREGLSKTLASLLSFSLILSLIAPINAAFAQESTPETDVVVDSPSPTVTPTNEPLEDSPDSDQDLFLDESPAVPEENEVSDPTPESNSVLDLELRNPLPFIA